MKYITLRVFLFFFAILPGLTSPILVFAQSGDVNITIHLRSVYSSKISLIPLFGTKQYKSITEVQCLTNIETIKLKVDKEFLPGEFILRFDYKELLESTTYPCEKNIIINNQDIELWVNPEYCNNPDSTLFQKGERENSAYSNFIKENIFRKEKLGLLQQFLMDYDDTQSKFYQMGISEYNARRLAYNQWLNKKAKDDKALFISSIYRFSLVPEIIWDGTEKDRMLCLIDHYFDRIDFNDPVIIRTSQMNEWMNSYMNLYGQMATTVVLRDSLIPAAAKKAIEVVRKGHSLVYGWMVDYFYRGFETNNFPQGMKMLEPYLNDTSCPTTKRKEINRRLAGMQTLQVGVKAPGISLTTDKGTQFDLDTYKTDSQYILILFWSADCSHCAEMVNSLYPWHQQPGIQEKIDIVAVSLDETKSEIQKWEQKKEELNSWIHMRATGGVNSKEANDFFILATPVMILIDSNTKKIVSMPGSLNDLTKDIN